jgi:serine/threonine protein phosphatase PrpC
VTNEPGPDEPWPTLPTPDGAEPLPAADGRCPSCTYPVTGYAVFCEGCGAPLLPTQPPPEPVPAAGSAGTRPLGQPVQGRTCAECGGHVGADGYCQTCGVLAPPPRDRLEAAPAPGVAGVSDRGVLHHRNEDALAVAVDGRRVVLVVCDGVSTSVDSDVASLAAAERAADCLLATGDLVRAAAEANDAVVATTAADSANAASATFAAAVIEGATLRFGTLGDSRVYWVGEAAAELLSVDDSVAQAYIDNGIARAEAEEMHQAHAITRWLGRDAPDVVPRIGQRTLTDAGWVVVCSDGLWNYASEPDALADQVRAALAATAAPLEAARHLVAWANAEGGKDNVTVALARWQPAAGPSDPGPEATLDEAVAARSEG